MNDSREFSAGSDDLRKVLLTHQTQLTTELETAPSDGFAIGSRPDVLSRRGTIPPALRILDEVEGDVARVQDRPFVSCFTEEKDSLSQWRAYGDYAIGFDTAALPEMTVRGRQPTPQSEKNYAMFDRSKLRLLRVAYSEEDLITEFRREMTTRILKPGTTLGSRGVPTQQMRRLVLETLIQRKEDSFRAENEWRLCYMRSKFAQEYEPPVKFREGPLSVVPYIELELEFAAIKEIWVGPSGWQELRLAAVERMGEQYCLNARILASKASFRSA